MIAAIKKDPVKYALAAVVLYAGYRVVKLGESLPDAARATGDAINPVNPDNIFYGAVNSVGRAFSSNPGWTLGSAIADITLDEPGSI